MGRVRAFIFTLLGAALTAMFVWTLVRGDVGLDRTFEIGGALFFGACTLVPFSQLFPVSVPPADADGSVTIPNSMLRSLALALAMFAVTAAAVLMWPSISQSDDWRKFAFLVIPIPCGLLGLRYLQWAFSGAPVFRFDKAGVTRYQWGERTTPWNAVTNVRLLKVRNTENVVLDVTPAHRQQSGWMSRLGGATGFGDVTLPAGASGLTPRDIEALVRRFWRPA